MRRRSTGQSLRKLREEFPIKVGLRQVDHDYGHITSTRREHLPQRKFFLGEIFWAGRHSLGEFGDSRPRPVGGPYLAGLVTRSQGRPFEPVELAPSANRAPTNLDELCFQPLEWPAELKAGIFFVLPYRRPVAREDLGGHLATLSPKDKQRLSKELDLQRLGEG